MALKRIAISVAIATVSTVALSACSIRATVSDAQPNTTKGDVTIVEAQLSDGRYLDCTTSMIEYNHGVLDCDWIHPRKVHDPTKQSAGTFQVFKKQLSDNRTLDCIATKTTLYHSVHDCDWS